MPCNSDYMAQTPREHSFQKAASLIVYVCRQLHIKCPAKFQVADTYYSTNVGQVERLCEMIRAMTDEERDRIVYNARSKESRDLADWWEIHLAADQKREAEENAVATRKVLAEQAKTKLSPAELKALKESL